MRCTCCLFMLTLWSAAAGCNNRMPMCIGSFSLHSKWIGLSKRDPNLSIRRSSDMTSPFPPSGNEGYIRNRDVTVHANIQKLCTAIEEEWTNIPQATINNLINSMQRRCVALHEANGGHTRYWLVSRPPPPDPQYSKTAYFRVAFYCAQPKAHLCNNHAV